MGEIMNKITTSFKYIEKGMLIAATRKETQQEQSADTHSDNTNKPTTEKNCKGVKSKTVSTIVLITFAVIGICAMFARF